jgi:hypothetical protein
MCVLTAKAMTFESQEKRALAQYLPADATNAKSIFMDFHSWPKGSLQRPFAKMPYSSHIF